MAMGTAMEQGITGEAVEMLWRRGEPEWLRERRRDAWETFESVPWPDGSQDEWRRVDLGGLDLGVWRPYAQAGEGSGAVGDWLDPQAAGRAAGWLLQRNSEGARAWVTEDAVRQGVLFLSLDEAVRSVPDRVLPYLGCLAPPAMGKLEALNGALWSGGAFLYVPAGVTLDQPLYVTVDVDSDALAVFPRTLVVAERGARVTLCEEHLSTAGGFASPLAEIVVGDGAHVRYATLQRWSQSTREIGARRALVGRDAHLEWTTVALGGSQSKMRVHAAFEGEGSRTDLRGLYLPAEEQEMHLSTLQDHRAPHTVSDLLFKGAVTGRGRSVYYGVIRVHPGAQQTNGYQQNRNLLLTEGARAESIPVLEIEANEVKCSHGSTTGQVDPEQLFYLMSRGLPRRDAEQLLVEGFFGEVLDRMPAAARDHVAALIARKIGGAVCS